MEGKCAYVNRVQYLNVLFFYVNYLFKCMSTNITNRFIDLFN